MADPLGKLFGLTPHEKSETGRTVRRIKGVATFFSDAIDALKNADVVKAIGEATPWWVEATGSAAAQSFPVIKFVASLFEKLTEEPDPQAVGLLACTLAYERAVEEGTKWTGTPTGASAAAAEIKKLISALDQPESFDFTTFSLQRALEHPFVANAEKMLITYLNGVGYSESQQRKLVSFVRRRFIPNLRLILSHAKLQKGFKPFLDLIQIGSDFTGYDALVRHVQYQRWLFEEAPVFGKEPFALQDVYIETECGVLRWAEIKGAAEPSADDPTHRREPVDAFSEKWGGRVSLLDAVSGFLQDPNFYDAVVIQGAAGSGKSSFTLKLCSHLEREGLYPIRIRLRDLSLTDSLDDALPRALFPPDHELPEAFQGGAGEDPFRKGAIFREKTSYGEATICPYVLILDGWDEISISATEGFKVRVARMLEDVRSRFLKYTSATIRVILTGRPSSAVAESRFLLNATPILTIRPIQPTQLKKFVDDLRTALEHDGNENTSSATGWTVPPPTEWKTVFDKYSADYKAKVDKEVNHAGGPTSTGSMDVLGLPLLAQLAIRLISEWTGNREELIESPTTLYRHMVDLTCVKGGKSPDDTFVGEDSSFFTGPRLRRLLQQTAAAMSVYGEESISFQELALRLNVENAELNRQATELSDTHILSALMISFFFKGGHQNLGCEFLHKSFREYLFAEAITESLRIFGRDNRSITPRTDYWKDFAVDSPLHDFSRSISELFAPQWLSQEVTRHLEALLKWECERAGTQSLLGVPQARGQATEPLTVDQWERIRDGLADVWHWWGDGVHLRPQPEIRARTRDIELMPAYVNDLIEHDLPYDPVARKSRFAPARSTTMDAHLGDALFRVATIVHFELARLSEWLSVKHYGGELTARKLWEGISPSGAQPHPAQSSGKKEGARRWVFFAPSGADPRYFEFFKARINAAGWRPSGPFPRGLRLDGIDLRGCNISIPFSWSQLSVSDSTSWQYSNLSEAKGTLGLYNRDDFTMAFAQDSFFEACAFVTARFARSDFLRAWFNYSVMNYADFQEALLEDAHLNGVHILGTIFRGATMSDSALANAHHRGDAVGVPENALRPVPVVVPPEPLKAPGPTSSD
jgi:uncharacterized protein YjbI with pentapeptide repeats